MRTLLFLAATFFAVSMAHSQTVEQYESSGYAKHLSKNYAGAIADFTKAIEIDPTRDESYNHRGNAKAKLEDYRGAILDYTKSIEFCPIELISSPYFNRGVAKAKLEDYRGAILDFNKVIESDPPSFTNAATYYHRGLAKLNLGLKDSGCLDLSKAGELGHADAYDTISESCK